jgi:hypothetical protein
LEALPEVPVADHNEILYLTDAYRLYGQGRTIESRAAALPKKLPEPFMFDWKQVQARL